MLLVIGKDMDPWEYSPNKPSDLGLVSIHCDENRPKACLKGIQSTQTVLSRSYLQMSRSYLQMSGPTADELVVHGWEYYLFQYGT